MDGRDVRLALARVRVEGASTFVNGANETRVLGTATVRLQADNPQ